MFNFFPATSLLGSNLLHCCVEYKINIDYLLRCCCKSNIHCKTYFQALCSIRDKTVISQHELSLLCETLFVRDGSFYLDFKLEYQQLQDIIISICTS